MKTHIVVIAGPTASGKTGFACKLAERYNLHILSADSRQVYKGLDLGTGKDRHHYQTPSGTIPCHLIDIAEPNNVFSLYNYQKAFVKTIQSIKNNQIVLLVGGSGMYIESILKKYRLSQVEEHPDFRQQKNAHNLENLQKELLQKNPALYNTTDISSKKRIIRALEINTFSNGVLPKSILEPLNFTSQVFCTNPPRAELYQNIESRVESRIQEGMIEEVELLLKQGVSAARMHLLGLEYRIITQYLNSQQTLTQMKGHLAQKIRHTAKAQITWFRGMPKRGIEVNWLKNLNDNSPATHIEKCLFGSGQPN